MTLTQKSYRTHCFARKNCARRTQKALSRYAALAVARFRQGIELWKNKRDVLMNALTQWFPSARSNADLGSPGTGGHDSPGEGRPVSSDANARIGKRGRA